MCRFEFYGGLGFMEKVVVLWRFGFNGGLGFMEVSVCGDFSFMEI